MARPALSLRVLPRFPARLQEGVGIDVANSGGVVTIRQDWTTVQEAVEPLSADDRFLLAYNETDEEFEKVTPDGIVGATDALRAANNLSELTATASTARTNLGLGNSATRDVGTTAGTVAAGDDSRFGGILGIASQAQAVAGTDNATVLSPLRGRQQTPLQDIIIECDITGTSEALIFTPKSGQPDVTAYVDGLKLTGVPPNTATTAAVITVKLKNNSGVDIGTAKTLRGPDGYANMLVGDTQKNKKVTIQYNLALDRWVLVGDSTFKQSIAAHHLNKLQSASATALNLDQDNGHGLLLWNPLTSAFRMVNTPSIAIANVFSAVNNVEGVANQPLVANQMYSVYVRNTDGGNEQAVEMSFWRTNIGAGVGWDPVTNEYGFYVKPASVGRVGIDNTYTYVGMIYTGGTSVESIINGSALQVHVCGHFNKWPFMLRSTRSVLGAFTTAQNGIQAVPRGRVVTDGISHTPHWWYKVSFKAPAGQTRTISMGIDVTGTAFDGSAFTVDSATYDGTGNRVAATATNGGWANVSNDWGVAVPMGFFEARPYIAVDGTLEELYIDLTLSTVL